MTEQYVLVLALPLCIAFVVMAYAADAGKTAEHNDVACTCTSQPSTGGHCSIIDLER